MNKIQWATVWERQTDRWHLREFDPIPNQPFGETQGTPAARVNMLYLKNDGDFQASFGSLGVDREVLEGLSEKAFDILCWFIGLQFDGEWGVSASSFWDNGKYSVMSPEEYLEENEDEDPSEEALAALQELFNAMYPEGRS